VGIRKVKRLYRIAGRRSILTFFAVSLYPVQTGHMPYSKDLLVAILIVAVPVIILLDVLASFARERVLKVEEENGE
jgi:hypothetical protein